MNKTSTRVEVVWNVLQSRALTDADREWLLQRLGSRLSADGSVRVAASDTRSQLRNRELAERRLHEMVRAALARPRKRKRTRPPPSAVRARAEAKRRRSLKKRNRRLKPDEE